MSEALEPGAEFPDGSAEGLTAAGDLRMSVCVCVYVMITFDEGMGTGCAFSAVGVWCDAFFPEGGIEDLQFGPRCWGCSFSPTGCLARFGKTVHGG